MRAVKRKGFPVILCGLGLFFVISCSSVDAPRSSEDRLSLTIMAPLHLVHPPSDEMIEQLEALTDTELDILWVPAEIYSDKLSMSVTTDSFMKSTFVNQIEFKYMKNAIRSDMFWDITPYIHDFPNLRGLSSRTFADIAIDGRIYGVFTERPQSRQGIILRKDWLDNLGLEKPETLDDLYDVLWQFTYNDPDRNGLDDTFGLTDRNDLIFGAFKTLSSYFGAPNNWGFINGRITHEVETQAYMDTMNFMKKLYDNELINTDFALTSKQIQRDLLISGTAGVYIGSMADAQRLHDNTMELNPDAEFTLVNRIEGSLGYRIWAFPNYGGLYLFSKTAIKTEEELLQIISFYNRTMDEDVSNLMRYGIEGKHYYVENEQAVLPDELESLRLNEVNSMHMLMIADISNNNILPIQERRPLTNLADGLIKDNNQFTVKDATDNLVSQIDEEVGQAIQKILSDATYDYILGNIDEQGFYDEVERWKDSGGADIIQEYNESYQRFRGSQ